VSDARPSPWTTLRRLQRWTWHSQTCCDKSEAVLEPACRGSHRAERARQACWPSLAPTDSSDEANFLSSSSGYRLYVRQRLRQATSGVRVTDDHPTVGWPALHRGLCGRRVAQQPAPAARTMRATVASRGKDNADQSVQQAALHALGAPRTLRTGGQSAVRYLIHGTSVAWRTRVVRAVPHPACKLPPRLPSACM